MCTEIAESAGVTQGNVFCSIGSSARDDVGLRTVRVHQKKTPVLVVITSFIGKLQLLCGIKKTY